MYNPLIGTMGVRQMAITVVRKRSPRAPLISLKEAVDRAIKVYSEEGRHPASADIVAKHLGYKSAENGAAKRALAALGYYGLIERPSEGMVAVAKSVEEYKFAPSDELRTQILKKWLATPAVFAELQEKFQDRLPSDASLKFELIQKGFKPAAADECLSAFRESVNYVQSVSPSLDTVEAEIPPADETTEASIEAVADQRTVDASGRAGEPSTRMTPIATSRDLAIEDSSDRIPVRLAGGRRAWLVIPSPFYAADKSRLISQIQLLLTDDEE